MDASAAFALLRATWANYRTEFVPKVKMAHLKLYLETFARTFPTEESAGILDFGVHIGDNVCEELVNVFCNRVADIMERVAAGAPADGTPQAAVGPVFRYIAGQSADGMGLLLLYAIYLLTRQKSRRRRCTALADLLLALTEMSARWPAVRRRSLTTDYEGPRLSFPELPFVDRAYAHDRSFLPSGVCAVVLSERALEGSLAAQPMWLCILLMSILGNLCLEEEICASLVVSGRLHRLMSLVTSDFRNTRARTLPDGSEVLVVAPQPDHVARTTSTTGGRKGPRASVSDGVSRPREKSVTGERSGFLALNRSLSTDRLDCPTSTAPGSSSAGQMSPSTSHALSGHASGGSGSATPLAVLSDPRNTSLPPEALAELLAATRAQPGSGPSSPQQAVLLRETAGQYLNSRLPVQDAARCALRVTCTLAVTMCSGAALAEKLAATGYVASLVAMFMPTHRPATASVLSEERGGNETRRHTGGRDRDGKRPAANATQTSSPDHRADEDGRRQPQLLLEVCGALVCVLQASFILTPSLLLAMSAFGGYAVLTDMLLRLEASASREYVRRFVALMWKLCQVGDEIVADGPEADHTGEAEGVRNVAAYGALLTAFVSSTSLYTQKQILGVIRRSFLNPANFARLRGTPVFRSLLADFHVRHESVQRTILGFVSLLLKDGYRLEDELRQYCALLGGPSPHSVLLVAHHMDRQMSLTPRFKRFMHEAGVVPALVTLLCPSLELPYSAALRSPRECALCLSLLGDLRFGSLGPVPQSPQTTRDGAGRAAQAGVDDDTHMPATVAALSVARSRSATVVARDGGQSAAQDLPILHGVTEQLLVMLCTLIADNPATQAEFCASGGLRRLYHLMRDVTLRRAVLRALAILGDTPSVVEWRIVPDIIRFLSDPAAVPVNSSGAYGMRERDKGGPGTSPSKSRKNRHPTIGAARGHGVATSLEHEGVGGGSLHARPLQLLERSNVMMRIDIARAVARMMAGNPAAKAPFCTGGGFAWALRVLGDTGDALVGIRQEGIPVSDATLSCAFDLVDAALRCVSVALKDHPHNQAHFRASMMFTALLEPLRRTDFINSRHGLDLCETLLGAAVRGTFPASCPKHAASTDDALLPGSLRMAVDLMAGRDDESNAWRLGETFADVVSANESVRAQFLSFLEARQCDHHLLFWLEVERFREECRNKAIASSGLHRFRAVHIFNTYVGVRAPKALTFVDARHRTETERRLPLCPPDLFDLVQNEARLVLVRDHYPAFLASATRAVSPFHPPPADCVACRTCLAVAHPELIETVLRLLASADVSRPLSLSSGLGIGTVQRTAVYCLKEISFLARTVVANRAALCAHGTIGMLIALFTPALHDEGNPAHHVILDIFVRLARYRMGHVELRQYLSLIHGTAYPTSLTDALVRVSERDFDLPCHYVEFTSADNSTGFLSFARREECYWPPPQLGYSIALWMRLRPRPPGAYSPGGSPNKASGAAAVPGKGEETPRWIEMVTLSSAASKIQLVADTLSGTLVLRSGTGHAATLTNFVLQTNRWHHVIVTHTKKGTRGKAGRVTLWVDGAFRSDNKLVYPASAAAQTVTCLVDCDPWAAPVDAAHNWHLASLLVLEERVFTAAEAFALYSLGPNYVGRFKNDPARHHPYELVSEANITAHDPAMVVAETPLAALAHIPDHTVFFYTARGSLVVQNTTVAQAAAAGQQTASNSTASVVSAQPQPAPTASGSTRTLAAFPVKPSGAATIAQRRGIREAVYDVGGMSVFLYLLAKTPRREDVQCSAMRLLFAVTQWSPQNRREMEALNGWQLVGKFMRTRRCVLGHWVLPVVLRAVCSFGGGAAATRLPGFASAIVKNPMALRHLVLDWRIWQRASEPVQASLVQAIADLVTAAENPHARFNIAQFRCVSALQLLLHTFDEQENFPPRVAAALVRLLRAILESPPSMDNVQSLFDYIIASHPRVTSTTAPTGTDSAKRVVQIVGDSKTESKSNKELRKRNRGISSPMRPSWIGAPATTTGAGGKLSRLDQRRLSTPSPTKYVVSLTQVDGLIEQHFQEDPSSSASMATGVVTPPLGGHLLSPPGTLVAPGGPRGEEGSPEDAAAEAAAWLGEKASVRESLLAVVLDVLAAYPDKIADYSRILKLDVLLPLLGHPSPTTRVTLLKIVDVLLRRIPLNAAPPNDLRTLYFMLGDQLRQYPVTEEMFAVLAAMMLCVPSHMPLTPDAIAAANAAASSGGSAAEDAPKPAPVPGSLAAIIADATARVTAGGGRSSLHHSSKNSPRIEIHPRQPLVYGVFVSLLDACAATKPSLWMFGMRLLQGIYVAHPELQKGLLDCGLVDMLCDYASACIVATDALQQRANQPEPSPSQRLSSPRAAALESVDEEDEEVPPRPPAPAVTPVLPKRGSVASLNAAAAIVQRRNAPRRSLTPLSLSISIPPPAPAGADDGAGDGTRTPEAQSPRVVYAATVEDRQLMLARALDFLQVVAVIACRTGGVGFNLVREMLASLTRWEDDPDNRASVAAQPTPLRMSAILEPFATLGFAPAGGENAGSPVAVLPLVHTRQMLHLQRRVLREVLEYYCAKLKPGPEVFSRSDKFARAFVSLCSHTVDHILYSETPYGPMGNPVWARLSASPAPSPDRSAEDGFVFIRFVFHVLRLVFPRSVSGDEDLVESLALLTAHVPVRDQLGRLLLHLLSPNQPRFIRSFVVRWLYDHRGMLASFSGDTEFNALIVMFAWDYHQGPASAEDDQPAPAGAMGTPTHAAQQPGAPTQDEILRMMALATACTVYESHRSLLRDVVDPAHVRLDPVSGRVAAFAFVPASENIVRAREDREIAAALRWREERTKARVRRAEEAQRSSATARAARADSMHAVSAAISLQTQQRANYFFRIRDDLEAERRVQRQWKDVIRHATHERAPWASVPYASSWQLDATEGPNRMRRRLKRCVKSFRYPPPREHDPRMNPHGEGAVADRQSPDADGGPSVKSLPNSRPSVADAATAAALESTRDAAKALMARFAWLISRTRDHLARKLQPVAVGALRTEARVAVYRAAIDELMDLGLVVGDAPSTSELTLLVRHDAFGPHSLVNTAASMLLGGTTGPAREHPLSYLFVHDDGTAATPLGHNLEPGESILLVMKAIRITPHKRNDGELLIGNNHVYFVDDCVFDGVGGDAARKNAASPTGGGEGGGDGGEVSISVPVNPLFSSGDGPSMQPWGAGGGHYNFWSLEDIKEIHRRRYLLKNNALEIFLTNGKTFLLAFATTSDRNRVYSELRSLHLPNFVDYEDEVQGSLLRKSITETWVAGRMSNFEYLMHLNTLAGRSFNDLNQYPVFPFILCDYTSDELDLTNPAIFRDLTKPMGAQDSARLQRYLRQYELLQELGEDKLFLYGSHYSTQGSVLHFLIRLEPFTRYFIQFQGGRFDWADRMFHDMARTWRGSSAESSSDVKELIPEFFYLPEFLRNADGHDFGVMDSGHRVGDVVLPPWARGDPRLFILKHRQALESRHVSANLHHWIDLIFGFKQTGPEALKANNLFYPLTYEGAVDVDAITDDVARRAVIEQIQGYGQTPRKLFTRAHPQRNVDAAAATATNPAMLCNSARDMPPSLCWERAVSEPVRFLDVIDGYPIAMGPNKHPLRPEATRYYVSWGHWDRNLRVCSVETSRVLSANEPLHDDEITCACAPPDGRIMVTGGLSGAVCLWRVGGQGRRTELQPESSLCGHTRAVRCVAVSREFMVAVSGSDDGTCITWDLNRLSYVRSLRGHEGPVLATAISPTTGDIVTVCEMLTTRARGASVVTRKRASIASNANLVSHAHSASNASGNGAASLAPFNVGGALRLWTVNGAHAATVHTDSRMLCACFSAATEGVHVNLVAAGSETGRVHVWTAWDLTPVWELIPPLTDPSASLIPAAITAVAFGPDCTELLTGDESGRVCGWGRGKSQRGLLSLRAAPYVVTLKGPFVIDSDAS